MVVLTGYLRRLRTSAAATATIIMTAAPMAMYVVVGTPLVGCGAMLGDGVTVWTGVGVGAIVSLDAGVDVATAAGVGAAGPTARYVVPNELP